MDDHKSNEEALESERIESLRQILEAELCRPVSYDEALEIGESLVNLFEALAEETQSVEQVELAL